MGHKNGSFPPKPLHSGGTPRQEVAPVPQQGGFSHFPVFSSPFLQSHSRWIHNLLRDNSFKWPKSRRRCQCEHITQPGSSVNPGKEVRSNPHPKVGSELPSHNISLLTQVSRWEEPPLSCRGVKNTASQPKTFIWAMNLDDSEEQELSLTQIPLSGRVRLLLAASTAKHLQRQKHSHPLLPSDSVWGSAAGFSSPSADPRNNPRWEGCKGNVLASRGSGWDRKMGRGEDEEQLFLLRAGSSSV